MLLELIQTETLFRWGIKFSLMFSQNLIMSSLSVTFSKAANLFEIIMWYCFLTCTSFSFLRLNLSTSNFSALVYLLPANLSLTFATTNSDWYHSSPESSYIECTRVPSPICQYVIHLVVSYPLRRGPGAFMNVSARFFYVEKFTILTPLSLSWWRPSFPVIGLKMTSLPSFALKISWQNFRMVSRKVIEDVLYFLIKTVLWIITFLLTWCMHIQNNDITQVTSQNYILHPIANKLYSFNCWYYFVVYKKILFPIGDFCFFFLKKQYNPCSYSATHVPPNLLYTHYI